MIHDIAHSIGNGLVEHAAQSETSARGLVTELFPYIYVAAKRMSTRAISAYLLENHQVKISAATVAKALREPSKHLENFADAVQPAGQTAADFLRQDIYDVLRDEKVVIGEFTVPVPEVATFRELGEHMMSFEDARDYLSEQWFIYDAIFRARVIAYMQETEQAENSSEQEIER